MVSTTHVPPADPQADPTSAAALAAATPASRDRYVDFLRAASICVVVLGHWLLAAVEVRGGRLVGGNLLQLMPWTQWLTWVFQVMPVFFIVGGFSNAASWSAARRDGVGYGPWLHSRLSRLLRPTAIFVGAWAVGAAVLAAVGVDGSLLRTGGSLLAVPLWFLAVYVLVVAAAPAMAALHDRFGLWVPVALALGTGLVDVLHWELGVPAVGWANFALVWLFAHQLGILWRSGRMPSSAALVASGVGGLVALTGLAGYPVSMVGGPGVVRTNNSPPSMALVALAVAQLGLVIAVRPLVDRQLARRRVWTAVVAANGISMTLYLWHLTALAAVSSGVVATGIWPHVATGSTTWWLLRPLWWLALAVALAPMVVAFARFERPRRQPAPRTARVLVGTGLVAGGLSLVALRGFGSPGVAVGITLFAAGLLAVRSPRSR